VFCTQQLKTASDQHGINRISVDSASRFRMPAVKLLFYVVPEWLVNSLTALNLTTIILQIEFNAGYAATYDRADLDENFLVVSCRQHPTKSFRYPIGSDSICAPRGTRTCISAARCVGGQNGR
jgi:hypothetical protein